MWVTDYGMVSGTYDPGLVGRSFAYGDYDFGQNATTSLQSELWESGRSTYTCGLDLPQLQKMSEMLGDKAKNMKRNSVDDQDYGRNNANGRGILAAQAEHLVKHIRIHPEYLLNTLSCLEVGQLVDLGKYSAQSPYRCSNFSTEACIIECEEADVLSEESIAFLQNNLFPSVKDFLEQHLLVDPVQGNLELDSVVWSALNGSCGAVEIPDSYVQDQTNTVGVPNSDLIIFITSVPNTETVLASALPCNFHWDGSASDCCFGRPLAASINISPHFLNNLSLSLASVPKQVLDTSSTTIPPLNESNCTFNEEFKRAVKAILHEMTHALGFSPFFYPSFPSQPAVVYDRIEKKTPAGKLFEVQVQLLVTPNVIQFARKHYGCSDLNGMPLEDFGNQDDGTMGAHWEANIAGDEYMVGELNVDMRVSGLSFSLLQDTGYYTVLFEKLDDWEYGKGQGCDFVEGLCTSWNTTYQCKHRNLQQCTPTRLGIGKCDVFEYQEELPLQYQHFSDPHEGGYDALMDFCPIPWNYETAQTSTEICTGCSGQIPLGSSLGAKHCASCRCFELGLSGNPVCLPTTCKQGKLFIGLKNITVECPTQGGQVTVPGYLLYCPPVWELCSIPQRNITPVPETTENHSPTTQLTLLLLLVALLSHMFMPLSST
ncbi:peptidase M8 [Pelomyxa schiedti]|nr:peptidase M8 [Pelomyxa schiedti]